MSTAGRWIARAAARFYPRAWRARYGEEFSQLVDDADPGLIGAADVLRAAARQHLQGGEPMRIGPTIQRPSLFAWLGLLTMLPTAAIVGASIVGHELGIASVADAVDPFIGRISDVRVLDLFLVGAPALAVVLAALPLLDVRPRGGPDEPPALVVRLLPTNIAVVGGALLLGALLIGHAMSESVVRSGA